MSSKVSQIKEEVKKIEKEENIKILFLIESGSRAWNWPSADSDYDIRGVFAQDYSNFDVKEQVNRTIGDLDIVLWDLKKFLKLMLSSNPSVWEWLSSDIVYLQNPLRKKLMKIYTEKFSTYSLKKHYISMAKQNYEKYLGDAGDTANLKKYLYILRSLACVLYIEKHNLPPPKNYKKILNYLPRNIQGFFEKIVRAKLASESVEGRRSPEADSFIVSFWNRDMGDAGSLFEQKELERIFKQYAKKYIK